MDRSVKSERKTRSMRLKENCEEVPKSLIKKGHYVRNPEILETNNDFDEEVPKSTRKLRRHTLKEQNITKSDDDIPVKKHKQSSRTKKNHTENPDNLDIGDQHNIETPEVKQKVKKSKKKKQEAMVEDVENVEEIIDAPKTKRKSKRRKKQSSEAISIKVEEIIVEKSEIVVKENMLNVSNISNESYHSAAGSIKSERLTEVNGTVTESETAINNRSRKKSTPKSSKKNNTYKYSEVENAPDINSFEKEPLKSESNASKTSERINKSMENKNDSNTSKIKLDESYKKRNSNENNCSKIKIDDTYEKPNSNENNCSKIKFDDTYEKPNSNENNCSKIKFDDTYEKPNSNENNCSKIKFDDTYEKPNSNENNCSKIKFDDTYEKPKSNENNCSKVKLDDTYEKPDSNENNCSKIKFDDTYEKANSNENNCSKIKFDDTYEKPNSNENNCSKIKFDDTYEKRNSNVSINIENINNHSMNSKRRSSSILLLDASNSMTNLNNTFDKSDKPNESKSIYATFEKQKLNGIYDLDEKNSSIKSDGNKTNDIANNSHISINSEDSKTENLINITAELVESSNDEISFKNSPPKTETQNLELPLTPYKREGTFTKESPPYFEKEPDTISIDSGNTGSDTSCRTPDRRKSLQSPGHTPFVMTKEKKTVLNVTRSIEKSLRRSSTMEAAPRATKVMFCSPTNQATVSSQIKRKVIKSNMKGSNKSFVFDSSMSELSRSGRKRSYTQSDADEVRSKRSKLEEEKKSVDRLSRPRTLSATVKTSEASTPSKKSIVSKTKPESKVTRTKLPNFTALHKKQFDKMESLDQCQERKAKRARQLLTPTGTVNMLERISPKEKETESDAKSEKEKPKPTTPCLRKSKTLTLTSLNPGYTRFGFKMNTSLNPFSVPNKEEGKANESKLLPSRTGATTSRREAAKQMVMREKSFTERNSAKRNESRTFIKGVRTNRRFQLQMQMRNVNMN
ncbi:general transcriptional corepressor trfA [Papilio machaon]|uniref:general transcriptional corepressor trfA n=1 Tax=Papilio machaon TaxID=76193 RepID=UPI001E665640|nr:general transcriptional corepressor trfA [Papilio machaon]